MKKFICHAPWSVTDYVCRPAFSPIKQLWQSLQHHQYWPSITDYDQLATQYTDKRVIAQQAPPDNFEQHYEPRIYLRGEIQTREHNWHDFFNLLVWCRFPKAKSKLNQIHYQHSLLQYQQGLKQRTHTQNFITQLDECGIIVLCRDDTLIDRIKQHQWQSLFWQQRQRLMENMQFFVFGHAIYEKLIQPYIGLTAKALFITTSCDENTIDDVLCDYLSQPEHIAHPRLLNPLPILGIPGWHQNNESLAFYQNTEYFRPSRTSN